MLLLLEKSFGVNWAFGHDASQPPEMFHVCVLFLVLLYKTEDLS